jgi:RNA polymerase sigma-70 factor (ECF subfamily)
MYFAKDYFCRVEERGGRSHYYISFSDGQAVLQEIEVSQELYLEFEGFQKADKKQQNFHERHIARHELSDEHINGRTVHTPKNVDEIIADEERAKTLYEAIAELPRIQRRRFVLYHMDGLTYEQIANIEGCRKCLSNVRLTGQQKKFGRN